MGGYAFGDSAAAARRLALLAEVFEPATRPFLERFAGHPCGLVVDLGCGPGHSTRLLAEVLAPGRILGLDQSPSFVALAVRAATGSPAPEFAVHDVTVVPFPCPPADLVFCRFLLSHLPAPGAALAAWATRLAPGGLLLVDEVERIHTDQPALRGYLEVAAALLAARGHALEVGARLRRLPDPPGLVRRHDRAAPLAPAARQAARVFGQNLAVWRADAVRAGLATTDQLDRLAGELVAVADGRVGGTIAWELRQLAFQRAEPGRA